MEGNRALETVEMLLAALLVIALSYGLTLWGEAQRRWSVSGNFSLTSFLLRSIAIDLILAVSLIALNWFVNTEARPNVPVSWTLLIVGALLTLYPLVFEVAVQNPSVAQSPPPMLDQLYPITILSISCTFIAVIGGSGLMRKLNE